LPWRLDQFHFVVFVCDAREPFAGLSEGIVEGLGQEPGLETVGVVEELALLPMSSARLLV